MVITKKGGKTDLNKAIDLSIMAAKRPMSFPWTGSKIYCKSFSAETYPHLPDVPLREKYHLFDINDTIPRRSYLWDNDIPFDIPENTIK